MRYVVSSATRGYLVDTCAGGTWNKDVEQATWYESEGEALDAMRAAEITIAEEDIKILPIWGKKPKR